MNGPPAWVRPFIGAIWFSKISPFGIGRFLGQK